MTIFDLAFWAYAFERMIKTAAQTAAGVLSAELLTGIGWQAAALTVAVATLGSVLTSIVAARTKFPEPTE